MCPYSEFFRPVFSCIWSRKTPKTNNGRFSSSCCVTKIAELLKNLFTNCHMINIMISYKTDNEIIIQLTLS